MYGQIWHTPAAEEPRCRRCAGEMLFLAQIYAPTEVCRLYFDIIGLFVHKFTKVHRSLYIYCCSSSGCVLLSDGWRVIRNQRSSTDKEDEGEIEAASIPPADATPVACGQVPTFSSIFDANSWGDVGGDELDDLEALLRQRDDALLAAARATPQVAPTALPLPVSEAGVDNDCLLKAFVIWQAIEPDPRVRTRKEGQGASDEHIMAMMHRYIAEEKDSLQEEGSTPSDATSLRLIEESMKRVKSCRAYCNARLMRSILDVSGR